MRKTRLIKLAAFIFAITVCLSISTPAAFAANETNAADTEPVTVSTALVDQQNAIAQYKAEVIRLVNAERVKVGAAEVKQLDALFPLADVRAQESAVSFSHTRPNSTRCFTIFGDYSMKYAAAGENLAYGFTTPADVVTAWMNSEGHRKNILDPDFKYIGIGYYVNENGRVYCSQLFYTPKAGK